ncbi:hypothetical protein AB0C76_32970 [Kitasatospora sp. NPDC048722]|uniref:hypothetical protein n=1 Tax=Kitasatospora sp. NPDC048722 TaxID=3155639 RepID=UPI0033DB2C68
MSAERSAVSADFVPLAARRPGLRITSYTVAADGTRSAPPPAVELGAVTDPLAYHPDARWPACRCGRHPAPDVRAGGGATRQA